MTTSSPGPGRTENNEGGRGRSAMSRLLHFLAWGCIVSGSGLLCWLVFQYALLLFVFRDATHANDTSPAAAFAFTCDVHYQSDRIATLNRSPNFYA